MKKLILIATGFVCLAGATCFLANSWGAPQAPAEETPHRVGLIDLGIVFDKYEKLKELKAEFQAEAKDASERVAAKENRARALQAELKEFEQDSPDYQTRENKLVKLVAEIETEKKMLNVDFQKRQAKMFHQVYLEVHDAVDKFCDKYKFTVVLKFSRVDLSATEPAKVNQMMTQPVMYHRNRDDLTDGVLKYLNEKYQQSRSAGEDGKPVTDTKTDAKPKSPIKDKNLKPTEGRK